VEEAFEQAGLAVVAVMVPLAQVVPSLRIEVQCEAPNIELLLADWLNCIVCEMSSRRMVFSRCCVRFQGLRLLGELWGEPLDPVRHEPAVEVKAATYYELRVWQDAQGQWGAQCVVDV
jgi:SHS2 domain-containing protein